MAMSASIKYCRLNHVKENDLAHGQFMDWYQGLGYNKNFVSKAIVIANELSNFPTFGNIGTETLYLIATLPDEEKQAQIERVEQIDRRRLFLRKAKNQIVP